jgi:hypothetical protein
MLIDGSPTVSSLVSEISYKQQCHNLARLRDAHFLFPNELRGGIPRIFFEPINPLYSYSNS